MGEAAANASARVGELRTNRLGRDPDLGGRIGWRYPLQIHQIDDLSLSGAQVFELVDDLLGRSTQIDLPTVWGNGGSVGLSGRFVSLSVHLLLGQLVVAGIADEGAQPRAEGAAGVVANDEAKQPDERFLDRVFGDRGVCALIQGPATDLWPPLIDDPSQGFTITIHGVLEGSVLHRPPILDGLAERSKKDRALPKTFPTGRPPR